MAERKNFDSEFCGRLPLHHINSIQNYGYLLVLDKSNLAIVQASENLGELLGGTMADLIGTSISKYLAKDESEKIRKVETTGFSTRIPIVLSVNDAYGSHQMQTLQHTKNEYIILELEKSDKNTTRSFADVFQTIKYISASIDKANSVQEVCEIAVTELRQLSGFDGVLMYRFDSDWNGTVLAEDKDEKLEQYLGQTFPASDIPKQARELYLRNPYRLIPDRNYVPVKLYPVINPLTNTFIDLSDCNQRGVAAVHLEYMKNMGIKSSMSIRVIHNGSLWGLISCHHIDEKYVNYELCSIFEWLSEVISGRVSMILNQEAFLAKSALQQHRIILTDKVYNDNKMSALFSGDTDILSLFKSTGGFVSINGQIETKGCVPALDDLENMLLWLEGKNVSKVLATDHLSDTYEDGAAFAERASGMLVIPVNPEQGDFVVCFRPEVVEDIHWGGDPNQAIRFESDGKNYHPRNSFKLWKQRVHGHALPWTDQELEVAESLRSFLFEFRTKQLEN